MKIFDILQQRIAEGGWSCIPGLPQPAERLAAAGYREDLICIGHHLGDMQTLSRRELDDPLGSYSLIVPAVMKARNGYRLGRDSIGPRTNDNTGKVYAVVFSAPHLSLRDQINAIRKLNNHGKLALLVKVGETHIEGWFPTATLQKGIARFCDIAMSLGAKWSIRIKCQPYALPGGINFRTKQRHRVIYLEEQALRIMHGDAATAPVAGTRGRVKAEIPREPKKRCSSKSR